MNLLDQDRNNLFTYESDVLFIGYKKFNLIKNDEDHYLTVISSRIKSSILKQQILDQNEVVQVLNHSIGLLYQIQIADLKYMVMNSFQNHNQKDFFKSTEILMGQSLCDLSLSDPVCVQDHLKMPKATITDIEGSLISQVCKNDFNRRETFKNLKMYK